MRDSIPHRDLNGISRSMLVSANEAAKLLGISRKTLWNHTAPRGAQIPSVRIGRVVRYRRETLERWVAAREHGDGETGSD